MSTCTSCFTGDIPNANRDPSKAHFFQTLTGVASSCACTNTCSTTTGCEFATFNAGTCILSASDAADGWRTGFLSSTTVLNDFHLSTAGQTVHDLPGGNFSGVATIDACKSRCQQNPDCQFFGYNQLLQSCFLKRFPAGTGSVICVNSIAASPTTTSTTTSPNVRVTSSSNGDGSNTNNGSSNVTGGNGGTTDGGGLSSTTIGIIVGVIGVIFLIIGIGMGIFFTRRRKMRDAPTPAPIPQSQSSSDPPSQQTYQDPNMSPAMYQAQQSAMFSQHIESQKELNQYIDSSYVSAPNTQSQYSPLSPDPQYIPSPNPTNEYRQSYLSATTGYSSELPSSAGQLSPGVQYVNAPPVMLPGFPPQTGYQNQAAFMQPPQQSQYQMQPPPQHGGFPNQAAYYQHPQGFPPQNGYPPQGGYTNQGAYMQHPPQQ
ncbi:hypothetical protein HK098_006200 [Nowakowskiella sp. JEL0407]|nr:hypothetical protein HK098_006200 [Nowakowskiella sp. JEL0407]